MNSIEPFVAQLVALDVFYQNETWAPLRRPGLDAFVRRRVSALSLAIGEKPYLDGADFTAGDLMMAMVLREIADTDILRNDARLSAYLERCLSRPAFKRALAAQMDDFKAAA